MSPLPPVAPNLGVWAKARVHRDCHVQFEYALYSVPFLFVGQILWLRVTDTSVTIYADYQLVAQHLRARERGTRRTVKEHLPPDAQAYYLRDRAWCEREATQIGPACHELVRTLLTDKIVERLRAAQGVIHLASRHGAEPLEAACRRALAHGSPHYRTVKTLLQNRPGLLAETSIQIEPHSIYLRNARFVRPAQSLFLFTTPTPTPTPEGDSR